MTPNQLTERRKALGLSVNGLGRALGVTGGAVSRWESGERAIPPYLDFTLQTLERPYMTDNPSDPDWQRIVEDMAPLYRYQIGGSGYWVECGEPQVTVVYPDGHEEIQRGIRITP
jgi:transcriptional regulator with XRE-family HTH domain